jgi:hypothetical protein
MLQNDPLRLTPLQFDADPDLAFHLDTDPESAFHVDADPDADLDPASQNDAVPCGSGSATLDLNVLHSSIVDPAPVGSASFWSTDQYQFQPIL